MSEEFINNFMEFTNKIRSVKEGEIVYLTFSIVHGKEKPGQRNVLVVTYEIRGARMQVFIQSPKDIVLEGVDEKKLHSMEIGGKKFYTNYNPGLDDFVIVEGDFYTIMNDEVLTVVSPDKNLLKLVEPDKSVKFQKDLLSYAKKFVQDVGGFTLCMVSWSKEDALERSRMVFFSMGDQTEVMADVIEGKKEATKILWEDIKNKKKLEGAFYTGKLDDEDVVCCHLDKNRVLVTKCTKGKSELLPKITSKVAKVIK